MTEELVEPQDITLRGKVRAFVESSRFRHTIMAIIIFNAITLGLGTSDRVRALVGDELWVIDRVVLTIFVIEVLLKFYAYRMTFFKSAWNIFDLVIVSLGLLPQSEGLSALRGLRVIRAMRLLSAFPQMRAVVQALLDALPEAEPADAGFEVAAQLLDAGAEAADNLLVLLLVDPTGRLDIGHRVAQIARLGLRLREFALGLALGDRAGGDRAAAPDGAVHRLRELRLGHRRRPGASRAAR